MRFMNIRRAVSSLALDAQRLANYVQVVMHLMIRQHFGRQSGPVRQQEAAPVSRKAGAMGRSAQRRPQGRLETVRKEYGEIEVPGANFPYNRRALEQATKTG